MVVFVHPVSEEVEVQHRECFKDKDEDVKRKRSYVIAIKNIHGPQCHKEMYCLPLFRIVFFGVGEMVLLWSTAIGRFPAPTEG